MKNLLLPAFIVFALSIDAIAQKPTPTPTPVPFLMEIEDVFSIAGAGMIATGKIESGTVKSGDAVEIELTESAGLVKGSKFSLRDGGRTIGIGVITALMPSK